MPLFLEAAIGFAACRFHFPDVLPRRERNGPAIFPKWCRGHSSGTSSSGKSRCFLFSRNPEIHFPIWIGRLRVPAFPLETVFPNSKFPLRVVIVYVPVPE